MADDRTDELLAKYLDGELSDDERGELDALVESNSLARGRFEQAQSFMERLESGDEFKVKPKDEIIPEILPTPLRTRIGALIALVLLVGGIAAFPFIKIEASLIEVEEGTARQGENRVHFLDLPGGLQIHKGESAVLTVRGGTAIRVTGPARFRIEEPEPHARVVLLEGEIEVERHRGDRECVISANGKDYEPEVGEVFTLRVVAD